MSDSMVGTKSAPFRLVIEEGKIHEFARAVRSESAEHFRRDAPVAPVTFLAVAEHWQPAGEDLLSVVGLDLSRSLHGGQEFVFHGPPLVPGTELTGEQRIAADYHKHGRKGGSMRFIEVLTEYRGANGDLVAEVRNTIIETAEAVQG